MPITALVTGATGFIGSHLVEALVAQNRKVTCLVRPKSQTGSLENLPVHIIRGSVEDKDFLSEAVGGQDYIFHLAARIRSARREVYDRANVTFTQNIAQACLQKNPDLKRFMYVSSIAAAGPSAPGEIQDETWTPAPTSEYGRTKLKGEEAITKIWERVNATIIRPPNVYGPRQQETELLIKLIEKRIVPVLKHNQKTTTIIYVKDLIRGMLEALESPKTNRQVYYLTDEAPHSWKEVILTIKKHVLGTSLYIPLHENIIYSAAWLTDILKSLHLVRSYFGRRAWKAMVETSWLFSSRKATRDFTFKPEYSLDQGIRETVAYYKPIAI
ncbi:MAG: NAD-dependent epimerase/dehydratase family protein [Candidatus Aminicenantes bacterium]|jgi:nucleoside-diphosphate-sugar epimerase